MPTPSRLPFVALLSILLAGAATPPAVGQKVDIEKENLNPWTSLDFPDRPRDFHFAIVSDNSAGPRPGVFADAVESLRRMRPDFVLSVGDFVRGFDRNGRIDDLEQMERDWREIEEAVARLDVPFFWVSGNNDLNAEAAKPLWTERFGRTFYSFVFEKTLFVVLDSDDPPGSELGRIGETQLSWLHETLEDHRDVRWTFVFLHRPLWIENRDAWIPVERLLHGRDRTLFSGHRHSFSHVTVQGYDYFTLATTGGVSRLEGPAAGTFDHVTWVAVPPEGEPRISTLMLDGLWGPDPVAEAKAAGR